jgi:hypothetical protein
MQQCIFLTRLGKDVISASNWINEAKSIILSLALGVSTAKSASIEQVERTCKNILAKAGHTVPFYSFSTVACTSSVPGHMIMFSAVAFRSSGY